MEDPGPTIRLECEFCRHRALAAVFAWIGAAFYLLLVGPIKQVMWAGQEKVVA